MGDRYSEIDTESSTALMKGEKLAHQQITEEEALLKAILRLDGKILGIVLGLLCGFVVFAMTNFLIVKGGPNVGLHLQLLNRFFIGYTVTFPGSIIGFLYGCLSGFIVGWFIAWVYNFIVALKERKQTGA